MTDAPRAALVTGASGGIGREIALHLAASGHFVIAHYARHADRAEETVRRIDEAGGCAVSIGADLTDLAAIDALFAKVDAELAARGFDALDVLVNNTGTGGGGTIADVDEVTFDRLIDTNAKSTFFVTQRALSRLRDGGGIINISSIVSLTAYPGTIAYAMAKAAVNSFTVSLAAYLGARRISVNAVAPGATDTPFITSVTSDPERLAATVGGTAMGRIGKPRDIARVVAFLASDDAAWITGQVIEATGGMHL